MLLVDQGPYPHAIYGPGKYEGRGDQFFEEVKFVLKHSTPSDFPVR